MKILREPLVHFLILGAVFYALYAWTSESSNERTDKVIRVSATEINRLDATWRARWNRAPTEEELSSLVRNYVRETALSRHAVAMGLDQNDPVFRRMLAKKLQNLAQDIVELSLQPTEQELRTYFETNLEQYQPPDLITFTHIFFDPDRRDSQTLSDAKKALAKLRLLSELPENIEDYGDRFMLQRYYPRKPRSEIAKLFGLGFTQSLFKLSGGKWNEPVLSGYGVHLVYVQNIEKPPAPEFAAVQEQVKQDWMNYKRKELKDEYVNEVLNSYEVVLEGKDISK